MLNTLQKKTTIKKRKKSLHNKFLSILTEGFVIGTHTIFQQLPYCLLIITYQLKLLKTRAMPHKNIQLTLKVLRHLFLILLIT